MSYTPQPSTVFVNHVVPLQHTDTGRKTDFRRKVTPEIGVTTQNSQNSAHNIIQSPKLTLRQLRDKLPDSSKINQSYPKFTKKTVRLHILSYVVGTRTCSMQNISRRRPKKQTGDVVGTRETYAKLHNI